MASRLAPRAGCAYAARVPTEDAQELAEFACPRCGASARERFYGPCATCREDLGISMRREARAVERGAYVPKMNVVPNHVATKE